MCTGNEADNAISPLWFAKKSEVAERSHGSKFRSASTDRPASAHAGLADVACDVCDQAWHCQPGEVPLPRVMLCSLRGARSRNNRHLARFLSPHHALTDARCTRASLSMICRDLEDFTGLVGNCSITSAVNNAHSNRRRCHGNSDRHGPHW